VLLPELVLNLLMNDMKILLFIIFAMFVTRTAKTF